MNDLFLDPTPNIFGDSEIGHGIHDFVQGGYNLFVINNRMSFEEAHGERSHKNKQISGEYGKRVLASRTHTTAGSCGLTSLMRTTLDKARKGSIVETLESRNSRQRIVICLISSITKT
jgi:hypothetical protein